MGSTDVAPAHAPAWLVPLATGLCMAGCLFWDACYVLMARRSMATRSYATPALSLALNASWELVYGLCVAEAPTERAAFGVWLALDLPLVWALVRHAPLEWRSGAHPWVGRHMAWLWGGMFAAGCWANLAFAGWWLREPGRGSGDKAGKWYRGREGYDTTELAYWSAAVAQAVLAAGGVAMLLSRGHSGGTGYAIWICRFMGSLIGLYLFNGVLWWYWPEAHGYFVSPASMLMAGVSLASDLVYPFVLWHVRKTEKRLPDGRLARGEDAKAGKRT